MSLLTKGVGQLIIDVVALTAIDADCNYSTAATITWTDLGETYQLERSLNATTWSIIYTGTAFTKSETGLANTDQQYFYRVKIVGDDKYSNIGYFQIYEQNKFIRDVGCYPAFNVSPYYFRKAYRQNCGERYEDEIDEARCKKPCEWNDPGCSNFQTFSTSACLALNPVSGGSYTASVTLPISGNSGVGGTPLKGCFNWVKFDWSGQNDCSGLVPGRQRTTSANSDLYVTGATIGATSVTLQLQIVRVVGQQANSYRFSEVSLGECSG